MLFSAWGRPVPQVTGAPHGGPSIGGPMRAEVGDHIVIETATLDAARRHGEVVEVIGEADRRHYRIRWQDGHESVYFPGPDARVTAEPDSPS